MLNKLVLELQNISNFVEISFKNQENLSFYESDTLFIYTIIFSLLILVYNLIFYYQIISLVFSVGFLFFTSGLYFAYLGGEFIGLTLILVYVGAILVLFLYFIMILDLRYVNKKQNYYKHFISLLIITTILVYILNIGVANISSYNNFFDITLNSTLNYTLGLKDLGYTLYGLRYFDIIILAFILLVGIYGVITMILQKVENRKTQDLLRQLLNKKKY